jgi:protein O-mannosyl-transferase
MRTWALIGLAALVVAAFAPVVGNDFIVLDDHAYVTENPHVVRGLTLEGVRWALTARHSGNWHPLTFVSHMADVELFGLDPRGHHLTSLLIHLANTLLLAAALTALTGRERPSLAVAALFAVHPLRVESVAWVAERKDLLSACFGLLALWLYAGFVRDRRWWRYGLVCLAFAASLASKPMLVTLPFLLLLLDFWPLGRLGSRRAVATAVVEKLPLLLLAGAASAIALVAQREWGAVSAGAVVPLPMRLGNAAVTVWSYLGKLFWPADLSPLYPLVARPPAVAAAAAAGLVAMTVLALAQHRTRPWLPVGWLWFCGTLVPVVGLVQIGRQAMADRYTYLPTVGVLLALVWGAAELVGRAPARLGRTAGVAALGGSVAALTGLTIQQAGLWRDSVTLFRRAVAVDPGSADCWRLLGVSELDQSGPAAALPAMQRAVQREPRDPVARVALGGVFEATGQPRRAADEYQAALRSVPGYLDAALALAWIRAASPDPTLRDGRGALAVLATLQDDTRANRFDAQDVLAAALAESGRFSEAVAAAEAALAQAPKEARRGIAARLDGYRLGVPFRSEPVPVRQ